ncbi:hypothetical protein HNR77_004727 [Paenibacillus sp. JGP012]|uniref:hypothetical protein n=1 Tax=Paenibacillus sp. JGP012 TaxID=2735914 RepID=UPI0016220111|nr:hypothetical protein [Paenibacillus sp. JGP012]MBB6023626.1 hypothetical protein [Paenibacillus sp. JGP012]
MKSFSVRYLSLARATGELMIPCIHKAIAVAAGLLSIWACPGEDTLAIGDGI